MKTCVCIVGWHYYPELFAQLTTLPGLDLFIVSHRQPEEIPTWASSYLSPEHIFSEPNRGYDWGAYQQFIEKGLYKDYEFVFFMHDDVILLDSSLFEVCRSIIAERNGDCVVGNAPPSAKRDWPRTHIHCYAHSAWKPSSWQFCHDTVRGSFLATSTSALDKICRFEVLWDRRGSLGVGAGNWSLRATSGRSQDILGARAFAFLGETYLSSPYLRELERGQVDFKRSNPSAVWLIRYRLIVGMSKTLMTWYMDAGSPSVKQKLAGLMEQFYRFL
jgi:hypothetical protein